MPGKRQLIEVRAPRSAAGKAIDIMDALRKSLENATAQKAARKPAAAQAPGMK